MNVRNLVRWFFAGAVAIAMGINGNGASQAYAQSQGQILAQQIRDQAVVKISRDRGISRTQSQFLRNQFRRPQQIYIPYQRTYSSFRPNYSTGYGNPYYSGYQYGYPRSYGGFGYGYGVPVYQYRIAPSRSPSSQSNRLPGSNYFGDPHASQYFGR